MRPTTEPRDGGADRAGVKEKVAAAHTARKGQRFENEELVAEGDAVFAKFNHVLSLANVSRKRFRCSVDSSISFGRAGSMEGGYRLTTCGGGDGLNEDRQTLDDPGSFFRC